MMEKLNYSPDYVLVASSDQSFCVAGIPQQKACILKKKKKPFFSILLLKLTGTVFFLFIEDIINSVFL